MPCLYLYSSKEIQPLKPRKYNVCLHDSIKHKTKRKKARKRILSDLRIGGTSLTIQL
jgi:hypothetical protein